MTTAVIVGIDPHRKVFTATALDERGRRVADEHFANTSVGHHAALRWARELGTIERIGIEGTGGLGRALAEYLISEHVEVRDVPPHKTSLRQRGRHEGKSDLLDAHRIAAETQRNDALAYAFKQSSPSAPDAVHDQISLWHNARTSLHKIRVQLIGEIDALIAGLPEHLRTQLPEHNTARARINSIAQLDTVDVTDRTVTLRLQLIKHRTTMLRDVLAQDNTAEAELAALVTRTGSRLTDVCGIAARAAAEILLETGDVRRFTEAGFARFTGTAPIPASSGEAGKRPVRHRLNRGGNRRLNAALHRIAMIRLRCEPRARRLYDNAVSRGHTRREAMRILKRHLSNILYRTMFRDTQPPPSLT